MDQRGIATSWWSGAPGWRNQTLVIHILDRRAGVQSEAHVLRKLGEER
jgi:hypothetical protein